MKDSNMKNRIVRPKVDIVWFSTVDEGRHLELNAKIEGGDHALAMIVADDVDESLWFELYIGDKIVQIPLQTLQDAIAAAPGKVHSETWYEANVPGHLNTELTPAGKALIKRPDCKDSS